jgi:hypothetical protein
MCSSSGCTTEGYERGLQCNRDVQNKNTEVTLLTPSNGQACYSQPHAFLDREGFKSYKAYISIDGKKYSNVYSGSGTSATLHSVLWRWFIRPAPPWMWYVDGTTAGGVT